MNKCPKCTSKDIKFYDYLGVQTIKCNKCGFDERGLYEVIPEENKSQKAKGEYSVYKTGGSQRTRRK